MLGTRFRKSHQVAPAALPCPGEPPLTYTDMPDIHANPGGRGADFWCAEDEVYPSKREPIAMDFQAPLHTPYGTAERTDVEFWGPNRNLLMERRNLLPDYAIAESEWDRNPRECGLQASFRKANPYEDGDTAGFAYGEELARTPAVREQSHNLYGRVSMRAQPTAWGADPVIAGGQGGMVPTLGPYLGKKGTPKGPVPDYTPIAGGAHGYLPPVEAQYQLPSATRTLRTHEELGPEIKAPSSDFGDETVNPFQGGRISKLTEYSQDTRIDGGFVASGADMTINDPTAGARWRPLVEPTQDAIIQGAAVKAGPDEKATPFQGGRERILADEFMDTRLGPGALIGANASLSENPQDGGRDRILFNWDTVVTGGSSVGIGSSLENNPQDGGRPSQLLNWMRINGAGGPVGMMGGLDCNDITGGNHWARTDGVVGMAPLGGFLGGGWYGGDVAFGYEDSPREKRTEVTSIMIPGPGAHGGGVPVAPEVFVTMPNTIVNAGGVWDDTPDPILQNAARSTMGAKALLNFTRENMDDLSVLTIC
jgi:hypothetical protein